MSKLDEAREELARKQRESSTRLRPYQERVDRGLAELRALLGVPEDGAGVTVGRSGTSGDIRIDYPVLRLPEGVVSITVGGRQLHNHARNDFVQDTLCRLLSDVLSGAVRLEVVRGA